MRYTIVEEDLGFFLGALKNYGIFAKNDIFGLSKAFSFETRQDAEEFIADWMDTNEKDFLIIEIETDEKYIDVTDLLRRGYSKYTHGMMDSIEMISTEIH
jgi:hypothetical protein